MEDDNKIIGGAIALIGAAVVAVTVLFGSWYTVPSGYLGVVSRNGAIVSVAEPGLGFKVPLIESVTDLSMQTESRQYENLATYSRDQQVADLSVSVNYRLDPSNAKQIVTEYGGAEGIATRLLDRNVIAEVKNVFGKYNAVRAVQERPKLNAEIEDAIRSAVVGPIIIESVQLENISFTNDYEESIRGRMKAEVEVETLRQNAEREKVQAGIVVTQAQAKADAALAQAKAKAEATRLQGEAEAAAITARANALRDNANLVELTQAEKWNGVLPTTMVPSASVPFLSVK